MKTYTETSAYNCKIIGIDLYCDGTTLSKSGTQSANTLRVRFANIKSRSNKWHDVGLAPILLDEEKVLTRAQSEKERLQLFQRLLYVALKDLINASASGVLYQGKLIVPRIVKLVANQPQERAYYCLKGSQSFRNCSLCEMVSKFPKSSAENNSAFVNFSGGEDIQPNMDTDEDIRNDEDGWQAFSIQISEHRANERDVPRTIECQLTVAESEIKSVRGVQNTSENFVHIAKKYLQRVSALEFPPALAASNGLGTAPFFLYKSIGFEKLHVFDLGIFRLVPDTACKRLSSHPYTGAISKLVRILNQRPRDLPRSSRLLRKDLFRTSMRESQAGISGKLRREYSPFLWVALMGLCPEVPPDHDPLLQSCLVLSCIQAEMLCVNRPAEQKLRTVHDIDELQKTCFNAGVVISNALGIRISTKLHRLMHHLRDHLLNYGCIRRGFTDENEAIHKLTERAYQSTNRRYSQLAPQLLRARTSAEDTLANEHSLALRNSNFSLLFRSHPKLQLDAIEALREETEELSAQQKEVTELSDSFVSEIDRLRSVIDSAKTAEDADEISEALKTSFDKPSALEESERSAIQSQVQLGS